MRIPPSLITAFPPSERMLLDVTRREIDDGMLAEIAAADYEIDTDLHLTPLRTIRDTGIVPDQMDWYPGEVLELIRWSNPEDPMHKPGSTGRRGHLMRAFACAALLFGEGSFGEGSNSSEGATLAQCLASAKELGGEMNEAAARFLTWRFPSMDDSESWLFALGLMVVAGRFPLSRVSDETLGEAAAWVMAEESDQRGEIGRCEPWIPFGVSSGYWSPLAEELTRRAKTINSREIRENVKLIGELILGG